MKYLLALLALLIVGCTQIGPYEYDGDFYVVTASKLAPGIDTIVGSYPERPLAVAIAENGVLKFSRGYNGADPRTPMNIQSLTKYVTADAVVKSGVDLDSDALPGITYRNLLSHSSGWAREEMAAFPYSASTQAKVKAKYGDVTPLTTMLWHQANVPLQFTPGSRQAYSTMSYAYLGHLFKPNIPLDPNWLMCGGGCAGMESARQFAMRVSTFDPIVWTFWPTLYNGVLAGSSYALEDQGTALVLISSTSVRWNELAPMAAQIMAEWENR